MSVGNYGKEEIDFTSDRLIAQPIVHLFNLFIVILFFIYLKKRHQLKMYEFETKKEYNQIEYFSVMVTNLADDNLKGDPRRKILHQGSELNSKDIVC